MTIVDRADGSAGVDAFVQGQGQRGQTVNFRYEAGVDDDGGDVAVAVECGAGDPKVDVGGKDNLDDGVAGIGGDAGSTRGAGLGIARDRKGENSKKGRDSNGLISQK